MILNYDLENRLVTGAKNGVTLANYTYDGDGRRVKTVEGGVTTVYIGDYYEWRSEATSTTEVKYYYAAGQRIAMRQGGTLTWLLGDHLTSTTVAANADGTLASEQKYTACPLRGCSAALREGQTRSGSLPTDRQYTGQISEPQLGLYFYNARFYDPYLARFISPDSIIPQPASPVAWDRYSYVLNNPINILDQSGHVPWFINGWNKNYMFVQDGNTCAVASAAVSLSILTGHAYTQADIQPIFFHTYDFIVQFPSIDESNHSVTLQPKNLAIGVIPPEQALGINTIFPGSIEATYSQGNRADLLNNLQNGCPTMVTIALPTEDIGHVIVVIGYDPAIDQLIFYDPAYGDMLNESKLLDRLMIIEG